MLVARQTKWVVTEVDVDSVKLINTLMTERIKMDYDKCVEAIGKESNLYLYRRKY